jgi:hypothetical protein
MRMAGFLFFEALYPPVQSLERSTEIRVVSVQQGTLDR